jgi:hypothetical protein
MAFAPRGDNHDVMTRMLCRLAMHRWDHNLDETGQAFLSCRRCGRERRG